MVLQPKSNLGGHTLLLGRPWLAIDDAFISCRYGDMKISHGDSIKKFILYPPTKYLIKLHNGLMMQTMMKKLYNQY